MSRYITTDATTGEIVFESNSHPMLAPLRPTKRHTRPQRHAWRWVVATGSLLGLLLGLK